jgi:hypothetical protein
MATPIVADDCFDICSTFAEQCHNLIDLAPQGGVDVRQLVGLRLV